MLHIHVLLVAPLGASYMAEPGTDQHQSRIAIREAAHYSGAAADLPVEPFNDIVDANQELNKSLARAATMRPKI